MSSRYKRTVLVLTAGAFFGTMVARLVISPVIPAVGGAFEVSKGVIGLALTGMWAMYALCQFPSGVLGEQYGERRVILLALGLTGIGSLLLAMSPSFPAFAVFALFLGMGAGLYFSAAASYLTGLFEDTGLALGFHSVGAPTAGLLAPVAATYVASQLGWRYALGLGAVSSLTVFVLVAWRVEPTPPENPSLSMRDRFDLRELVSLLGRPGVAFTTVLASVGFFAWQSFASFFPTFLIEHAGFSAGRASLIFGLIFGLSAPGLPALGKLSDAFGRDALLATAFFAACLGYGIFLSQPATLPVVAVGTLALGVGTSWTGVINSRFMDRFDASERGAGFGLVRTTFLLVSSTGSVVTGTLAGTHGWTAAYGLILGMLGVAGVALLANRAFGVGL
ncbi:MFS transporter [Haloplanus sp. GCM10025708]|uniref:MFS transporter n=1 Tax=Haloferacaceae TaxID=1644056 RepID=UPI00361401BB